MRTEALARGRVRGPRFVSLAAALLVAVGLILIGSSGGASAAAGPTDLALTKSDSPDPVLEKSTLTYAITVQNLGMGGTADATDVKVTDTLPDVDFVSATASSGTCQRAGSVVTCDLGTVNAGAAASVTIVVKSKKSGTLSNTAAVSTTVADTNAANNQDTETTLVNKASKTTKTKKGKGKKGKGKGKKGKASCASPTITGTAGNDSLTGTAKDDVIVTLTGNDRVVAGDGKDVVCTGAGADFVSGGPKDDVVIGGPGPDSLFGNAGKDALKGKAGRDRLRGNADDDFLNGGRNRDNCRGGGGADTLVRCP
jgi:uncharacterized repeat protein (TIGR01451 family)